MTIIDDAFHRTNCFGIGAWLAAVLEGFGHEVPSAMLDADTEQVTRRSHGLVFAISRVSMSFPDWRDELVLARIEGDQTAPMPLGLDPSAETATTATAKLPSSTAGGSPADMEAGDRRVSFFFGGRPRHRITFSSQSRRFR